MKNGTRSDDNKLVLVNSSGRPVAGSDAMDDAAVDYHFDAEGEPASVLQDAKIAHKMVLVLLAVSIACTTAAVATGSYAVWLSRHHAAHQALTDVNDILKSCQSRMLQLEADVQRLPDRKA